MSTGKGAPIRNLFGAPTKFAIACLIAALGFGGCRLMHGEREIKQVEAMASVSGTVIPKVPPADVGAPIVVAAFRASEGGTAAGPTLRNYAMLIEPGPYQLYLPPFPYQIWAFADLNHDFIMDPNEPRGAVQEGRWMKVDKAGEHRGWDIHLSINHRPSPVHVDLSVGASNPDLTRALKTIGVVTSLEDSRFRPTMQTYGLWRPVSSISKGLLGLFFLEKYDPCRTPVLYIHGMSGSPREFERLIGALDKDRFQPWIFSYPSNFRLHLMGDYLWSALREVKIKHEFKELVVVAHSMGGLIARDALLKIDADQTIGIEAPMFISLSTPWNGQRSASSGLEFSPVVIPSWIDIVPNSAFITGLFARNLSKKTRHHLLFGFVDGDAGDGTLTTASMIDPRAQYKAASFRGFPVDHAGILTDDAVLAHYLACLSEFKPRTSCRSKDHAALPTR